MLMLNNWQKISSKDLPPRDPNKDFVSIDVLVKNREGLCTVAHYCWENKAWYNYDDRIIEIRKDDPPNDYFDPIEWCLIPR